MILKIQFQSIWDGGTEVLTDALLDLESGEIVDIESTDDVEELDMLDSQSIFIKHGNLTAAYDVIETDDGYFISKKDLKTIRAFQAFDLKK